MFDRDLLVFTVNDDLADDKPQESLALGDRKALETVIEPAQESLEVLGEAQVGLGVAKVGAQCVELGGCRLLTLAQDGHPLAQLIERDQLFLVGLDQACLRGARVGELMFEGLGAQRARIVVLGFVESAFELVVQQLGLADQVADLTPDQLVKLLGADLAGTAHPATGVTRLRAEAAVINRAPALASGGGTRHRVATPSADEHSLQQRGLFGIAWREALVVFQAFLGELELLVADERRHRDERPLLRRTVLARRVLAVALAPHTGGPRRAFGGAGKAASPERCLTAIGGVAQHRPHRRAVPHRPATTGGYALLCKPARDRADRFALLGVAAEDLAYDLGLDGVDLQEGVAVFCLFVVAVAVGRARQRRLEALAGPVQLSATCSLGDLGPLVLGDHALELAQQLVLGRPAALGLLGEADLHAGALELLQQHHLVGVAAGKAVRGVTEHHLEGPLGRPVTQTLKGRALEAGARDPVIAEDELLGDQQAARVGQLTQPCDLTVDRLLLALAIGGDPGVDRRDLRLCGCCLAAQLAPPLPLSGSLADALARPARRPVPAAPRRAGRPRTRSQPAVPPRRRFCSPSPSDRALAVTPLMLSLRAPASSRSLAINDAGSLTVNTSVRSGTSTGSDKRCASRTYRRAWRSEIP